LAFGISMMPIVFSGMTHSRRVESGPQWPWK
jgi:hypothetical protein